ncbi:hypothetical protein KI659_18425 [Litoribacter alkaliphilus]|uniref:Uncharacterized protein n=1 Tax=Litoribacter ruber TaxID=702568 RepID=A0AAP2CQD1_9BACT|nr:hypothetical protein [Litoribacter alkaliphilus]MBS9526002.1 hypothetical protein [Litoribacter alkaliphilus]
MNHFYNINIAGKSARSHKLFSILTLFLLIILILNSTVFKIEVLNLILITLILISGVWLILFKKTTIIGSIKFHKDYITIQTNELPKLRISTKDLTTIKFYFGGNKGDSYILNPQSINFKDGTDNKLIFTYNKRIHTFDLLITTKDFYFLNKIIKEWNKDRTDKIVVEDFSKF